MPFWKKAKKSSAAAHTELMVWTQRSSASHKPDINVEKDLSQTGISLYKLLGIQKGASSDEIKKAYRKLALRYHPDKTGNNAESTEKFKEINYANTILTDDAKRGIYDRHGSYGIYMAEHYGDELASIYLMSKRKKVCLWVLSLFCCIVTGCYCLCCCCMCCNFCCGKCRPKFLDEEEYNLHPHDPNTTQPTGEGDENADFSSPVDPDHIQSGDTGQPGINLQSGYTGYSGINLQSGDYVRVEDPKPSRCMMALAIFCGLITGCYCCCCLCCCCNCCCNKCRHRCLDEDKSTVDGHVDNSQTRQKEDTHGEDKQNQDFAQIETPSNWSCGTPV